jgi:hypothetical protein
VRFLDPDVALAREWARFYRSRNYNPLPSRRDRKVPAMRSYTRERDHGIDDRLLERWWSPNIQLCCGARWSLVVVDIDGPGRPLDWWESLARAHAGCRTWTVATRNRDGSYRGRHYWFDPEGESVTTRLLHGDWDAEANRFRKRSLIELKGEKALIVAPPSIHPETGQPYAFLPGFSPVEIPRPAPLPTWVRDLPAVRRPRPAPVLLPLRPDATRKAVLPFRGRVDPVAVLECIPDRIALVTSRGLRIAGEPNASGWCRCHCLDRPDLNPSASFHRDFGYYCEPDGGGGSLVRHSLFELGALIGPYSTWLDCLHDLARIHHVPPRENSHAG